MDSDTSEAPTRDDTHPAELGKRLDLADLVSLLLAAETPDRDLDLLVHVMLGGRAPVLDVDDREVKTGFWLRAQVPEYTAGREALSVLGHARGLRVSHAEQGGLWYAEAKCMETGDAQVVTHPLRGIAGTVAVAAVVARRAK